MTKVLHVPFCYFPDAVGGTEVYAGALAGYQTKLGLTPVIAAPALENAAYSHEGIPIYRFRTSPSLDLRDQYGEGDSDAAAAFDEILERIRPDIVHLHAFTSAVSLRLVRAAGRRNIPVVFTYHTPTVTCDRGTLLLWGAEICDGVMDVRRCARCGLHANGLPKPASWLVGSLPAWLGARLGEAGLSGSAWTALEMSELSRLRRSSVRALFAESSQVIAVCGWVKELLIRNGVPTEKITLCRQGLAHPAPAANHTGPQAAGLPLRVAFFGRLDAVKGIDTLIEALRLDPDLPVTLDIFAVAQDETAQRLKTALAEKTSRDARIRFQNAVAPQQTVERLREYNILAVPSRWMETGPMVVYEAFAAGTPVVGSNLGGLAELVEHEKNGLLVETDSAASWAAAFRRLVEDRELLARLKRGMGPVRTMQDVAREMQPVYRRAMGELVQ
jgi:glycosyltransferase involved in cell wall biosynthesis